MNLKPEDRAKLDPETKRQLEIIDLKNTIIDFKNRVLLIERLLDNKLEIKDFEAYREKAKRDFAFKNETKKSWKLKKWLDMFTKK